MKHEYYPPGTGPSLRLVVQVDADFSVVLLPTDAAAIMSDARRLALQTQYGFPLKPASEVCAGSEPVRRAE